MQSIRIFCKKGGNEGLVIGDMRNGMTLNFTAQGAGRIDTSRIAEAIDEPAYMILGEKRYEIASGDTSRVIAGLESGKEYSIMVVTREKATILIPWFVLMFAACAGSIGIRQKRQR